MAEPFIGQVQMWGLNFAPFGFSFCNGGLLAIVQDQTLFSIIGNYYGGNGNTNFALPNLQGRVPLGPGSGPGLTPRGTGQFSGEESVYLVPNNLPSHTHEMGKIAQDLSETNTPGINAVMGLSQAPGAQGQMYNNFDPSQTANMADTVLSYTGDMDSHENRQPYLAINFCIARIGLYPSRN